MILTVVGDNDDKISVKIDNIVYLNKSFVNVRNTNPCTLIVMRDGITFKVKETVEYITYIANNLPRINNTTLIDRDLISHLASGYMCQYGGAVYYKNDTNDIK